MKLLFKKTKQPVEAPLKRGPKVKYGGQRVSFFPGDTLSDAISATQKAYRDKKLPCPAKTTFFRKGWWLMVQKLNADLKKAISGSFHAKDRKGV